MTDKPNAPATGRNSQPILDVLRSEFATARSVLEIGSGTGQHAVYFARELENLVWHTSDRAENIAGITTWVDDSGLRNVRSPIELDVLSSPRPDTKFDAVFSANTAHIMSFAAVRRMFEVVAHCLQPNGVFCLYGPFNEDGEFTSPSNEQFDLSLRGQNPQMGIRDIRDLDDLAKDNDMQRLRNYAMPANNQIVIWTKAQE